MASQSSLEDKAPSGRFYMNKIFGRGLEHVRALESNGKSGHALGTVRRVTIEPTSGGGHTVRVERSGVAEHVERGVPASVDRIGESLASEHSFGHAGDALRFLSDVLNDHPASPAAGRGEAGRFLDQVLDSTGGN